MATETTQYTEVDLRDAIHAQQVDQETGAATASRDFSTDEKRIFFYESGSTHLDLNDPDDLKYFEQHDVSESLARYYRGKELLKTCKVIWSSRGMVMGYPAEHTLGNNSYEEFSTGETILSPVLVWPAGHIATTEVYRYVALALRKKRAKRVSKGREHFMTFYQYRVGGDMAARINLDEKAAIDGYTDARDHFPDGVLEGAALEGYANQIVADAFRDDADAAQDDPDKRLTDDQEEYRARYVSAYIAAYTEEIAELRSQRV